MGDLTRGSLKRLVEGGIWAATVNATVPSMESGYVPVPAEYHVIAAGIYL